MKNGDRLEFVLSGCDNGVEGAKFKEELVIDYRSQEAGLAKTIKGSIAAKVQ